MSATLVVVIAALGAVAVRVRHERGDTAPVTVVYDQDASRHESDRRHDLSRAAEQAEWEATQARHQAWLNNPNMCHNSCCS